jgi:hypothetical protein
MPFLLLLSVLCSLTGVQIVTYLHLLGLRAVTSFRTGRWEMPTRSTSRCTLSNFTPLLASAHVPHNQAAKRIFVSHFLRASHAKLYSIKCIGGSLLTEEKVGRAFEHALKVQMLLQKQDMDHICQQQHADAIRIGVSLTSLTLYIHLFSSR